MKLDIYIRFEEKIEYLRKLGYTIGKRKEHMWWSVYHNDTEEEDVEVWYVQKNGIDYGCPSRNHYGSEEWVDSVFQQEIHDRVKKFVLAL